MAGISGMAMMLKGMGIDPVEMQNNLTTFRDEVMSKVESTKKTMEEILESQKRIENLLTDQLNKSIIDGEANTKENCLLMKY